MLLCQTFTIYKRTVASKKIKEIKGKLAEELYTFKAGTATTELIFGIRQLTKKKWEYGNKFLMTFRDYKTAYDSMKRKETWKSLEKNWNCTRSFEKSRKYT
jgi:hypothetical protein